MIMERRPATEEEILASTWRAPAGVLGWLKRVEHKELGLRYIVTAFIFLLAGGIEALLMRFQLAVPNNTFLGPDHYNEIFTTHGTTMMFLACAIW